MAHILVIDDEPSICYLVALSLRGEGHLVETASSGKDALRLAEDTFFDLVVTDVLMPDMDGIEILQALCLAQPGLPVVAMSGGGRVGTKAVLDAASVLGATAVLAKPFSLDELKATVNRALGGSTLALCSGA